MPYSIIKTNGSTLTLIQDGTIDNSTSLNLPGKNYSGYGRAVNEDLVYLLENFAGPNQPNKPLTGQVWYDNVNNKLKYYDGSLFRPMGVIDTQKSINAKIGDLYFDSTFLYAYNGTEYVLIGPSSNPNAGTSGLETIVIIDTNSTPHTVLEQLVGGNAVAITSNDALFSVPVSNPLAVNFPEIPQGITISNTNSKGISATYNSSTDHYTGPILWGTAATAVGLVQDDNTFFTISDLVKKTELATGTNTITVLNDSGITVGANSSWKMHVTPTNVGNLSNLVGTRAQFNVTSGTVLTNVISLDASAGLQILPNSEFTVALGATGNQNHFNDAYINNIRNSTTGHFYGNWTLNSGSWTLGSGATLQSTVATQQIGLNGSTAGTVCGNWALATGSSLQSTVATQQIGLNGSTAGTVCGNWLLGSGASLQANVVTQQVGVSGSTAGTVCGNWALATGSSLQSTVATQQIGLNGSTAGTVCGNWSLGSGATLQSTVATQQIGVNGSTAGTVCGNWSLGSGASLQSTVATQQIGVNGSTAGTVCGNWSLGSGATLQSTVATQQIGVNGSTAGTVYGNWTLSNGATFQATYADIAERYEADAIYEPGTVLIVGGAKEVTMATRHGHIAVAGIVSTNPAYTLNAEAGDNDTHPYIALKGRVPCKVTGNIVKGDILVTSSRPGYAEKFHANDHPLSAIGRALEDFNGPEGVIEVMVI